MQQTRQWEEIAFVVFKCIIIDKPVNKNDEYELRLGNIFAE